MSFVLVSFLAVSFYSVVIPQENLFVILMCGYNNAAWVVSSLHSVCLQNNQNYRIIYIDDASTDNTYDIVSAYCNKHKLHDRMLIIRNTVRRRKLANWYDAIHNLIDDNEVVVLLDADDRLAHADVLTVLDAVYTEKKCWFAYSQYRNDPAHIAKQWGISEFGSSSSIPEEVRTMLSYRNHTFIFMHLRTFYAWLFKQIAIGDLISDTVESYCNAFFPASNDLAIMFPMVEMATDYIQFIPEVLYIRNLYPDNIGFKIDNTLQSQGSIEIRGKKKYIPLDTPKPSTHKKSRIDVFIIASSSDHLLKTLASYKNKYPGTIRYISVMLPSSNQQKKEWHHCIQRSIKIPCYFYTYDDELITIINKHIATYKPDYIYIATQHTEIPHTIPDDIAILQKTKANILLYDSTYHEKTGITLDTYAVCKYKETYEYLTTIALLSRPLYLHTLEYTDKKIKMSFSEQTVALSLLDNKFTDRF